MSGKDIWTGPERRWRDALLGAMIPRVNGIPLPSIAELDLAPFWAEFRARAPFLLKSGFRISVWILTFLPVLTLFSALPFHRMDAERRDAFLKKAARSNFYPLRQLAVTIKLIASLAYFRDPGVRALFPGVPVAGKP